MPYYRGQVVSDDFLQDLYRSYRNCNRYADSGDAGIRDRLESAGVSSTGEACSLGSRDESDVEANIARNMGESQAKIAVQTANVPAGYSSGAAPAAPVAAAETAVVYAASPAPVGQTTIAGGSPMIAPSPSTSGPANSFGGYSTPGGSLIGQPTTAAVSSGSGFNWMWIALAAAAVVGVYFVARKA